jgi:hypothetical protein
MMMMVVMMMTMMMMINIYDDHNDGHVDDMWLMIMIKCDDGTSLSDLL